MKERWKIHPSHIDYEISDMGRVRRRTDGVCTFSGRILSPLVDRAGYLLVNIYRRKRRVHRLVLETFVGPCPVGCEGRHIDDVKINNNLLNLAWGTPKQNYADWLRNGGDPLSRNGRAKVTPKMVRSIRNAVSVDPSCRSDMENIYGLDKSSITRIINRTTWGDV